MNSDVTVVVRSVGERTTKSCVSALSGQLTNEDVNVVEKVPFESALKRCFEIGINANSKWLLTIDADVLPIASLIPEILDRQKSYPKSVCMFSGKVYDKFFGAYRKAGVRVYQTSWLSEAIIALPRAGTQIRPESFVVERLMKRGAERKYSAWVVGIHDYEQYYRDIFRTSYLHAKKHEKEVFNLLPRWVVQASEDTDFLVAVHGAVKGFLDPTPGAVDARLLEDEAASVLDCCGLVEKPALNSEDLSYFAQSVISEAGQIPSDPSRWMKWREELKRLGMMPGARWMIGDTLQKLGGKLKSVGK
jgi:hypothetical protein